MISLNGGYAMIKYNSTQEELQIAYRSKKPVLCYDENRRAHWAVIEETATESVDEETQEPITIYEYSYRLIDEASGGKSYEHIIVIETSDLGSFALTIQTTDNTPFTIDLLLVYLNSRGHNSTSTALSGVSSVSGNWNYVATGVYRAGSTTLGMTYIYYNNNALGAGGTGVTKSLISSFTDTVTEV